MTTQLKITQTINKQILKIAVARFINELVEFEEKLIPKAMIFSQRNKFYNVSLDLKMYRQLN